MLESYALMLAEMWSKGRSWMCINYECKRLRMEHRMYCGLLCSADAGRFYGWNSLLSVYQTLLSVMRKHR